MSLLALQLPPRQRLGPRATGADAARAAAVPVLWAYSHSPDGQRAGARGVAAAAALPAADEVVLALAATDVSWHRVRLPKAPASRMRAALLGLLEEQLLEEDDAVHLALAAGATPGADTWVAATHAPHLVGALAALQAAGVHVARVVSALPTPGAPLRAHFAPVEEVHVADEAGLMEPTSALGQRPTPSRTLAAGQAGHSSDIVLTVSTESGAWHLPVLQGAAAAASAGLVQALRQSLLAATPAPRWTATPQAAGAAQQFLGRPVPLQTTAEHLLEVAQSATNLRQFALLPRHRGLAALGAAARQLRSPEWRTARWGLAALLGLHLVGLNAAAWAQQQALQKRRAAVAQLLRSTHPGVQVVLDAALQMRAENDRLRAAAGRPGPADLEAALAQAATAWPEGKAAVQAVRFEAGRLTLSSAGWNDAEVAAFRDRVRSAGWEVTAADGLIALTRAAAR